MKLIKLKIEGFFLIEHELFEDNRGLFRRSFCNQELKKNGINFEVKQGNVSENYNKYTMRGFHFQKDSIEEAKIITCLTGAIYNVVIDLRKHSKTYQKSEAVNIDCVKRYSLLVPGGCANAFLTLENNTIVHYYMNDYFKPANYSGFRYNDPYFDINWPHQPLYISEKDENFSDYHYE